jgi:hypothetical protein
MTTRFTACTICLGLCLAAASAIALTPCHTLVVPAAARGAGVGSSVWQMDLYLINSGARDADAELYWLERDADNRNATPVEITVPAGETVVLADVILERFGRQSGGGAIRIESDHPIAATSRIYNLQSGVTFGQGFDGLTTADATTACCTTVIGGLQQDAGTRSNVFAVAGEPGASFRIDALTPAGATLGSATFTAPPWGAVYVPLSSVADTADGPVMTSIWLDSGHAWFAGSRIDQASGDPFTVAAVVPDPSLLDLTRLSGGYAGTWRIEALGLSGTATMVVAVVPSEGTAAIVLDFDGPLLNGVDPGPATVSGPLGPGSATFYGVSPEFGSIGSELDAHGHVTWTAAGGSDPGILMVEASGMIAHDQVLMSFIVTLAPPLGELRGELDLVPME